MPLSISLCILFHFLFLSSLSLRMVSVLPCIFFFFNNLVYFWNDFVIFFCFIYTLQFLLILLWSRPCSIKFSVKDFLKYLQEIITIYHQWKVTVSFQVKLSNYQKPYRVENNSKTKICFPNQLNFFQRIVFLLSFLNS